MFVNKVCDRGGSSSTIEHNRQDTGNVVMQKFCQNGTHSQLVLAFVSVPVPEVGKTESRPKHLHVRCVKKELLEVVGKIDEMAAKPQLMRIV